MSVEKVVVAMSGGVDSSVALALLKEQGYECVGVSMQLWDYSEKDSAAPGTTGSCCSLEDINDARGVAGSLGVPFYVLNVREAFSKEVVDYFINSYASGTTPNPCIKCNEILKFEVLLKKALGLEASYLATGHYARILPTVDGFRLFKGVDPGKDQSYFLFTMTQAQLKRVLFPLGGLTKKEVRDKARQLGLKTSEKQESQEICFVQEPSYTDFMAERISETPGEITDTEGNRLGTHGGLFNFTIGQRKGLNLSGGPHYVLDMDTGKNRLIVGPEEGLYSKGLFAEKISWIDPAMRDEALHEGLTGISVKVRYSHPGVESVITVTDDNQVRVDFITPQRAVTPGQAAVFYKGEEVIGGGWIKRPLK